MCKVHKSKTTGRIQSLVNIMQVDTFLKLISECTKYPARAKNVDTKAEIGVLIREMTFLETIYGIALL